MKRTNSKILWVAVLAWTIPVYGQTDQGVVRLNLKDASSNGPPDTLLVYVEVATVQPDVEQGIVFTLNIVNNGSQTIRIMDPVDTTKVLLSSSTRHGSVSLRNTRPDANTGRLRGRNEEQLKAYYDDKKARRPFEAFDSEEALRDQRIKTVSDIVPWNPTIETIRGKAPLTESARFEAMAGGKLTLEPGERFQAVLRITRILADPKGHKEAVARWERENRPPDGVRNYVAKYPRPQPQIVDITPGTYRLSVHSLVFTDAEGASWAAMSDRVTIELGEANSPEQSNESGTP